MFFDFVILLCLSHASIPLGQRMVWKLLLVLSCTVPLSTQECYAQCSLLALSLRMMETFILSGTCCSCSSFIVCGMIMFFQAYIAMVIMMVLISESRLLRNMDWLIGTLTMLKLSKTILLKCSVCILFSFSVCCGLRSLCLSS